MTAFLLDEAGSALLGENAANILDETTPVPAAMTAATSPTSGLAAATSAESAVTAGTTTAATLTATTS